MIKNKFTFLVVSALMFLLCHASLSEAFKVVVVKGSDITPYNEALEGFKTSCGCNMKEFIISEMENEGIMEKVLESSPDAVLAIGMDALIQVQEIKDIPVVYTMVPYLPFLDSIGKSVSGVTMFFSPERYLSTMVDVFPSAKRIGVVYDPKNTDLFIKEALQAAQSKRIELVVKKASRLGEVPSLIDDMKDEIDLLWMLPDMTIINSETINYMLLFSFRNRVPVFTFSRKYVEMGALASLNIIPFDLGVQAGEIVKEMLSSRAVISPIRAYARKTALTINRKLAKKLGIKVQPEVGRRAEDVN